MLNGTTHCYTLYDPVDNLDAAFPLPVEKPCRIFAPGLGLPINRWVRDDLSPIKASSARKRLAVFGTDAHAGLISGNDVRLGSNGER